MSPIDVAVAIVSYRCADLTIDCLRSVEAERSTVDVHIRAIVVDNASGDASLFRRRSRRAAGRHGSRSLSRQKMVDLHTAITWPFNGPTKNIRPIICSCLTLIR